jgi:hypothetical protein
MRRHSILVGILCAILLSGCGDDTPTAVAPAAGTVKLSLFHHVGAQLLVFNDIRYTNAAGDEYSVVRLNYLISDVELVAKDGARFLAPGPFFIDAAADTTLEQVLAHVPPGTYEQISFTFGLNETLNNSGEFIQEAWHAKMAWPDPLGGGYHYMILDGFVAIANPAPGGPTERNHNTHLGRTQKDPHYFRVTLDFDSIVVDGNEPTIFLGVDVNEWYESPNTYAFPDPAFIMDRPDVQETLKANGGSVFEASTTTPSPAIR